MTGVSRFDEYQYEVLVVDSRLIAKELRIEHKTFLETIGKYKAKVEKRFGVITFQTAKPLGGSRGGRPEKYALLTEPQATILMTFSRNTEPVVECKLKLVEAFEKAKKVIAAQQRANEIKSKYRLTSEEIVELCILPVPTPWKMRFPPEYYEHLSRLTNINVQGHTRPKRWAMLTKELVYDYLPDGVYRGIRKCRSETGSWDKLHQFLSEEGLELFERHYMTLMTLMFASASINELKRLLDSTYRKEYQLMLF